MVGPWSGTALGLSLGPNGRGMVAGLTLPWRFPRLNHLSLLAVRPQPIASTACTDVRTRIPVSISTSADYQGNHCRSTYTRNHGMQPFDLRKHTSKARAPWLTSYAPLLELRSEAIYLLPGHKGPPAEVPARDFEVQRCPSRHLYVRLLLAATVGLFIRSWRCQTKTRKLTLLPGADMIDKATKEIKQDDDKTVYKSLEEIGEDLPDHSPRFVLLSYPMTLVRNPLS